MDKINVKWVNRMLFYAKPKSGHSIFMDTYPEVGGYASAATPMEHFLSALAGCTGMDVVSILRKMRIIEKIQDFSMEIEYERAKEHPKVYTKIHLIYKFTVKEDGLDDKIKKAVELSQERYCSVSAMIKKAVEDFTYEIVIDKP